MQPNLRPEDEENVAALVEIRQKNNDFCWLICNYLNNTPKAITKEAMDEINGDGALPNEVAYTILLSCFCGLDPEGNEPDRKMVTEYFHCAVKRLETEKYLKNPFYQNIHIPDVKFENWELRHQTYAPYEAFVYKDLISEPNHKEYPGIGFFDQEFQYPSVMENGHEWMAIKPSELETIQPAIDAVAGKVVAFGLGLGYFAYMASLKTSVSSITIVECDPNVIALFKRHILPQFEYSEKVKIIFADALEYAEQCMPRNAFDYAFVDVWHDAADGLDMYLKMKKKECLNPGTTFLYWVEESLLSSLRWQLFDDAVEKAHSVAEIEEALSNARLRELAALDIVALPS